mgnify:CR=1 FL=1|tara:strand:+ start:266 stop:979 length:714 start_codon:yes stop_codon:yes gene_type:complete
MDPELVIKMCVDDLKPKNKNHIPNFKKLIRKYDYENNFMVQLATLYALNKMNNSVSRIHNSSGESEDTQKLLDEITTLKIENEGLKKDVERIKKRNKEVAYQYRNWKSETNELTAKISDLQKELEIFKQRTIITENELWKLGHKNFNNPDGKEYKFYSKGSILDDSSDEEDLVDDIDVYGVITEEDIEKAKKDSKNAMTSTEPPPVRYDKVDNMPSEQEIRESMSNWNIDVGIPQRD